MAVRLAEGHSSAWSYKVEQKGAREKKYAEQHLKGIEYRTIRLKLAAHRKLNQKITREYERGEISKQVFDEVILAASNINKRLSQQEQKQVDEILKKKWISYQKLAHDIRFLEDKTRHGIPLKGKCDLCRS